MNYLQISRLLLPVACTLLLQINMQAQTLSLVEYTGKNEIEIKAGKEETVELSFMVLDNFYIQGNKLENEYFIPTVLNMDASEKIKLGDIKYPVSVKYQYSPEDKPLEIFKNEIVITVPVRIIEPTVEPTFLILNGTLHYQACSMSKCYYPRDLEFALKIKVKE